MINKYPNGQISYEGYSLNGQAVGENKTYYPDGNIRSIELRKYVKNNDVGKLVNGKYFNRKNSLKSEIIDGTGFKMNFTNKNKLIYKAKFLDGFIKFEQIWRRDGSLRNEQYYNKKDCFKFITYYDNGQVKRYSDDKEDLSFCLSTIGDTADCMELIYGKETDNLRLGIQIYFDEWDIKSKIEITADITSTMELTGQYYDIANFFEYHKIQLTNIEGHPIQVTKKGKKLFSKFGNKPLMKDLQEFDSGLGCYINEEKAILNELFRIENVGRYKVQIIYFHFNSRENKTSEVKSLPVEFDVYDDYGNAW